MTFITGDKHANFRDVIDFCTAYETTEDDIMIILGDAGINYFLNIRDYILKNRLKDLPVTFFCIHGNHEERPENIDTYITKEFHNGTVYYEEEFPNILFAKDGEIYNFNGNSTLVIGGAYSVDKENRIKYGYNWYPSEQPSEEIKERVRKKLKEHNNEVDIILSHTCPYKYIPTEMFIDGIDNSKVDHSTELFLDEIEKNTNYKKWYCGHYHTDKEIDNIRFMMYDIEELKIKELTRKRS